MLEYICKNNNKNFNCEIKLHKSYTKLMIQNVLHISIILRVLFEKYVQKTTTSI